MSKGTCSIDGCGKPVLVKSRGWCSKHYNRWWKHGDPLAVAAKTLKPQVCIIDGCDGVANEPGAARDWCRKHYTHWQRHGDPLASASCANCGLPIPAGGRFAFCTRTECRRRRKKEHNAKQPKRRRAQGSPVSRRASEKRYRARADRKCVRPGCEEFAAPGDARCRRHIRERAARRYARKRLRLPRLLYVRQVGLCPDADHGGCGLPLGDPDGNHVDHLIPEVRNGPQDEWNLQLMHPECNMRKSDSIVPAALVAAAEHGIALARPDGTRPRSAAA